MCALPLEVMVQQPQQGLTTEVKFRQLIDLAIGSPEMGHVNFHALHWLLSCFAEKLNIIEDKVDFEKYRNLSPQECMAKLPYIFVLQQSAEGDPTIRWRSSEDEAAVSTNADSVAAAPRLEGGQDEPEADRNADAAADAPCFVNGQAYSAAEANAEGNASAPRLAGGEDEPAAEANAEETADAPPAEENAADAAGDDIPADDIPDADAVEETAAGANQAVAAEPTAAPAAADDDSRDDDEVLEIRDADLYGEQNLEESLSGTEHGKTVGFLPENYITKSELNLRLMTLEATLKSALLAEETQHGLSIMKDQLEVTMEHLNLLMPSLLLLVQDAKKKRLLQHLLEKLLQIKDENVYIEGSFRLRDLLHEEVEEESALDQSDEIFHSDRSIGECREEAYEECLYEGESDGVQKTTSTILLEQMARIKSEICDLYNKINDLSQAMLELDSSRLSERFTELEETFLKYRTSFRGLVEQFEFSKLRINENNKRIIDNHDRIDVILSQKVDYNDMEIRLAEKAEFKHLARKVSHEKLDDTCFQMQKQICEVRDITTTSERNILSIIDNLYYTLGMNAVERKLSEFRELIKGDINELRVKLQAILDAQNACAAAGARSKVLEHVQCLSCDTPCIMRNVSDKNKAPKDAPATKFVGSFVTYAVGNMRRMDDAMGYASECQLPHAKSKKPQQKLQKCVPRHSGGAYTIMTPKDKIEKIFNKRVY